MCQGNEHSVRFGSECLKCMGVREMVQDVDAIDDGVFRIGMTMARILMMHQDSKWFEIDPV
ncbi:uncharacterized protein G2W53_014057 [Senna tora]|uniref:Uncharacterized protein n=1 Tax=Senna tora TaxID=362788 RepID=A0A834WSW0_9FABA|nr:uncharacterized protein G2W53_014057 [Senna tora]